MNHALLFNGKQTYQASLNDVWPLNPHLHSEIMPPDGHIFIIYLLPQAQESIGKK